MPRGQHPCPLTSAARSGPTGAETRPRTDSRGPKSAIRSRIAARNVAGLPRSANASRGVSSARAAEGKANAKARTNHFIGRFPLRMSRSVRSEKQGNTSEKHQTLCNHTGHIKAWNDHSPPCRWPTDWSLCFRRRRPASRKQSFDVHGDMEDTEDLGAFFIMDSHFVRTRVRVSDSMMMRNPTLKTFCQGA